MIIDNTSIVQVTIKLEQRLETGLAEKKRFQRALQQKGAPLLISTTRCWWRDSINPG